MNGILVIFFTLIGSVAIIFYHADYYFSVWLSVMLMAIVTLALIKSYQWNRLGVLILLLWLVYALPFIHIPPYIWFDFETRPILLWGLAVNPYMVDERVIQLTAMIGAVGALGFAVGALSNRKIISRDMGYNEDGSKRKIKTLDMPIWLGWVALGILLTAMSAPEQTVFTATYTESGSFLGTANFSSAWMVSYVILSFAFSDTLLESNPIMKKLKNWMMVASIVLVVVYYQLLRGDRESIPWVFGLALAYFYWAAGVTQRQGFGIPWLKFLWIFLIILITSMVVGVMRSELSGAALSDLFDILVALYESDTVGLANIFKGTWSAVLLTPLSVAGDHIYGLLQAKYGTDYLDLLLSTIPGFLADATGYVRPIDGNHGPAWEMRYGIGGTHATVVPFMNFGMMGVFLITAIWARLIASFEKKILLRLSVTGLSFLITMTMASPHWFWYGEKNGMNSLVMWVTFAFIYRISLGAHGMLGARSTMVVKREKHFVR